MIYVVWFLYGLVEGIFMDVLIENLLWKYGEFGCIVLVYFEIFVCGVFFINLVFLFDGIFVVSAIEVF